MISLSSSSIGLGDTLLLNAVARYLDSPTVFLPRKSKRFEILFDKIAKVEIVDDDKFEGYKYTPDFGTGLYARQKLRGFFGNEAEFMDVRPVVLHSNPSGEYWAGEYLKDKPNPVIVCWQVATEWQHVRGWSEDLTKNVIQSLKDNNKTPIVIQSGAKNKWAADTVCDLELDKLICLMRQVGEVVTAHTGLFHLAVGVGAKIDCIQPPDSELFNSSEWNYSHPTIDYHTWN